MEQNNYSYTYSAPENQEVQNIRKKWAGNGPKTGSKFAHKRAG